MCYQLQPQQQPQQPPPSSSSSPIPQHTVPYLKLSAPPLYPSINLANPTRDVEFIPFLSRQAQIQRGMGGIFDDPIVDNFFDLLNPLYGLHSIMPPLPLVPFAMDGVEDNDWVQWGYRDPMYTTIEPTIGYDLGSVLTNRPDGRPVPPLEHLCTVLILDLIGDGGRDVLNRFVQDTINMLASGCIFPLVDKKIIVIMLGEGEMDSDDDDGKLSKGEGVGDDNDDQNGQNLGQAEIKSTLISLGFLPTTISLHYIDKLSTLPPLPEPQPDNIITETKDLELFLALSPPPPSMIPGFQPSMMIPPPAFPTTATSTPSSCNETITTPSPQPSPHSISNHYSPSPRTGSWITITNTPTPPTTTNSRSRPNILSHAQCHFGPQPNSNIYNYP